MTRTIFIIAGFVLTFFAGNCLSQNPSYVLTAQNFSFSNDCGYWNTIDFDIYIRNTGQTTFEYAGGQYFLAIDPLIANGGMLSYSLVGSDLPQNLWPRNPSIGNVTNPPATILRLATNPFPGAGNGYIISSTGQGTKIARVRLSTTDPTFADIQAMEWRNPPIVSFATKIFAYVNDAVNDVTTSGTHSVIKTYCGMFTEQIIPFFCCRFYVGISLTAVLEGTYDPLGALNREDTITIQLRYRDNPGLVFRTVQTTLDSLDLSAYAVLQVYPGDFEDMYLVVKHFNSIETWSSLTQSYFWERLYEYDFTRSDTSAYGGNLKFVSNRFAIFSGDVNQDKIVDGDDMRLIDNDIYVSLSGRFIATDLNGDGIVDGSDLLVCENNAANFIEAKTPENVNDFIGNSLERKPLQSHDVTKRKLSE